MKYFLIISLIISSSSYCQTWISIPRAGTFETAPYRQFSIDPYTNNIWLITDTKVSVIENDGTINIFTNAELGTLWTNDNIQFTFTTSDIFYAVNLYGLKSFTGYTSTVIDSNLGDYLNMSSNGDTVYVTLGYPNGFIKHSGGISQVFFKYYSEINAKHNFFYGHDGGSVIYQYDQSTDTQVNLTGDPQYLYCLFNDVKFSRKTDTLFVGSVQGISYAYNYDFLDTITPNNTLNMPSSNVLEIEFDDNDRLWAVFGDENNLPFAIAKLEGNNWTTIFDAGNSPIDFSSFLGLEIDTVGNLWVADNIALHTFLTSNSPQWLGQQELVNESNILVYPNPAKAKLSISTPNEITKVRILDFTGSTICTIHNPQNTIDVSSLSEGVYFISIETVKGNSLERFVKE